MNLDPFVIADFIQKVGVIGLLILILVGGAKKVWVFGWYADELRARAEKAEQQRDHALGTASRAVDVTEKVT